MRSNTTSVISELTTLGVVTSALSRTQVLCSDDHVERSYGCQISLANPKQLTLKKFTRALPIISPGLKAIHLYSVKVLTIDEERDICHPHTHSYYNNYLLPVPNGDSTKLP